MLSCARNPSPRPDEPVDQATMATRGAVFPLHGLFP
jgi:hypothetical protein